MENGTVKIYSCGPTVYYYAHIGNFRSYIFADVLRRSLKLSGYKIQHAMNLTDVDDKTIRGTREKFADAGEITIDRLNEFTAPFIDAFFEDMKTLGIEPMEYHPRATRSMEAMSDLVEKLKAKGLTYEEDGSIYFSIKKFPDYGKLSRVDLANVKTGLRYNTDEYTKDDIRDFVLWKKEKAEEGIAWDIPAGRGRPGWHLECSAMIQSIFNGPIDIHTGGVDLLFPHHENEIAQSRNAYGHSFVNYWMHCEHLMVDGKKMSKSEGNFYTLRDILDKGFDPMAVRYALLSVHYRQKLNFTFKGLMNAENTLFRIWVFMNRLHGSDDHPKNWDPGERESMVAFLGKTRTDFISALEDDLNISKALSVFHDAIRRINQFLDEQNQKPGDLKKPILETFYYMDSVLNILEGFNRVTEADSASLPEDIKSIASQRSRAREEKNFARADELRESLFQHGYKIMDFPDGTKLIRI